jgi:hypothetical protein
MQGKLKLNMDKDNYFPPGNPGRSRSAIGCTAGSSSRQGGEKSHVGNHVNFMNLGVNSVGNVSCPPFTPCVMSASRKCLAQVAAQE